MALHHYVLFMLSALPLSVPALAADGGPVPGDPVSTARSLLTSPDRETTSEPVTAQTLPNTLDDELGGGTIGAVHVVGATDVTRDQFANAIAPFLGRAFHEDNAQELLGAISGVARRHGYAFASSRISPQTVHAGILTVEVVEGRIDEIRLEGEQHPEVAKLLSALAGGIGRTDDVDRLLMLATDLPGVTIGKVRYIVESGRGVLIVPVNYDRVRGWASLDNRGSHALGPVRAQIGIDAAALLSLDDRLTFQSVVTPADPGELSVLHARYSYMLAGGSTEVYIAGTYGRTNSGGPWEANDPRGRSIGGTVGLTRAITRGRNDSLWASVDFAYLKIDQWWDNAHIQRDRIAALSMSLNGYTPFAKGRLRAGMSATQALPIIGATRPGDLLASRSGAGSDYLVLRAWANWTGPLAGLLSARIAITTQLASEPLLAVDQIAIGGPSFGRGYDFSERAGDEGVLGSVELRADLIDHPQSLLRGLQVYAFADGGVVHDLRGRLGTGDLASAGAGTRLRLGRNLQVGVEAAFPLSDFRYDSGDKAPLISAAIGAQF